MVPVSVSFGGLDGGNGANDRDGEGGAHFREGQRACGVASDDEDIRPDRVHEGFRYTRQARAQGLIRLVPIREKGVVGGIVDREPRAESADFAGNREPANARIEYKDAAPGGGRFEGEDYLVAHLPGNLSAFRRGAIGAAPRRAGGAWHETCCAPHNRGLA